MSYYKIKNFSKCVIANLHPYKIIGNKFHWNHCYIIKFLGLSNKIWLILAVLRENYGHFGQEMITSNYSYVETLHDSYFIYN